MRRYGYVELRIEPLISGSYKLTIGRERGPTSYHPGYQFSLCMEQRQLAS
jgi:hypothetical protein